ncbi:hypothetical protein [Rhizobium sp.]|jgi:hypothetical protein
MPRFDANGLSVHFLAPMIATIIVMVLRLAQGARLKRFMILTLQTLESPA